MNKLFICTKCGEIQEHIIQESTTIECSTCKEKMVELTAITLLQTKANIYGYKIFDVGDECPNCHGHDIQRMIPTGKGPTRLCKNCNATWDIK